MTPDQLRDLVDWVRCGGALGLNRCIEILEGHAAAMEEVEKYKRLYLGDDPAMGETVQYRRELVKQVVADKERAERRAERLKGHAEALIDGGMKAITLKHDYAAAWQRAVDDYRTDMGE